MYLGSQFVKIFKATQRERLSFYTKQNDENFQELFVKNEFLIQKRCDQLTKAITLQKIKQKTNFKIAQTL